MSLRKTLKTKRAKRRVNRNKRQVKPKVKQSRPKRIIQRAVDNIREHILQSEEYQNFIEELGDFELTDAEPIIINVDRKNVRIIPSPEATPMFYGFKIYYRLGRELPVFIQQIPTRTPEYDDTTAFGA